LGIEERLFLLEVVSEGLSTLGEMIDLSVELCFEFYACCLGFTEVFVRGA